MARGGKVSPAVGVWMANGIFAVVGIFLLWRTDKLPIEIGLGQVLMTRIKGWGTPLHKLRDERAGGFLRRRLFNPKLTAFVVGLSGLAIIVLAFFGPLSRLVGRVPSAVRGEAYLYPLLSLFAIGVVVLLAPTVLLILDDYVLDTLCRLARIILSRFLGLPLIVDFFCLPTA